VNDVSVMQVFEKIDGRMIRNAGGISDAGCVAVTVTNLRAIKELFGSAMAADIEALVSAALSREFAGRSPQKFGLGSYSVMISDLGASVNGKSGRAREEAISRAIRSVIMADAVRLLDQRAILALDIVCIIAGETAGSSASSAELEEWAKQALLKRRADPSAAIPSGSGEFAATMARANSFLGHLFAGDMSLLSQPVCRTADNATLYQHFTPAILQPSVTPVPVEDLYQDLCTIGAPRETDEFLVWTLLVELLQDRNLQAGVRICGQSARLDHWWSQIIELLEGNRQLACRFVIEIDGAFSSPGEVEKVQFCRKLKQLGVRIVLGQFGTGASGLRDILTLQPDHVKIEPGFLWRAQSGDAAFQTLRHLVGLTASLRAPAIVCGVDSEELARLAIDAGALWQSGSLFGTGRSIHLLQGKRQRQ
jgi:EAL domain-containing protein (putative c-di-GMP-specific phosphodiesterase class I)